MDNIHCNTAIAAWFVSYTRVPCTVYVILCFTIHSFSQSVYYFLCKDITLMPTSYGQIGDKWSWTMIVTVAIGAVILCLIITIICSIVTAACRNNKR